MVTGVLCPSRFMGPLKHTTEEFFLRPGSAVLKGQPALGGAGCQWRSVLPGPTGTLPKTPWGWAGPGPAGCGMLVMATESLGALGEGALAVVTLGVGARFCYLQLRLRGQDGPTLHSQVLTGRH